MKKHVCAVIFAAAVAACMLLGCAGKKQKAAGFVPRLDQEAAVELQFLGFFGNFEALDQVMVAFNEYYPNVSYTYNQVATKGELEYLRTSPMTDIIMTSMELIQGENNLKKFCADLSGEELMLENLNPDMLKMSYDNERLVSIPIGQNLYGMVVNETLLQKEGLSIPQTYAEFLSVLEVLKERGYMPIQGPESKVYAELTLGMMMNLVENNEELYQLLQQGDEAAVQQLLPALRPLELFLEKGYISSEVNQEYPEDNYDKAILKFFEGNVPFWICNSERVSGMKKRESKSETFREHPFEYSFVYAPLGEQGVYAYHEPWYGLAVNSTSDQYEYAVEFMRFFTTEKALNKMADVKGIPTAAKQGNENAVYSGILNPAKVEQSCVRDERFPERILEAWYSCINKCYSGQELDKEGAVKEFVKRCGDILRK